MLRKLFKKPAILLVTLWTRMAYNQGVRLAEERWKNTKPERRRTIYLVEDPFRPSHLTTMDKDQFKVEKKVFGYHARLLTMNTLRNGCYYYTADKYGNNRIPEKEKEIRRSAFVKERLRIAGLI